MIIQNLLGRLSARYQIRRNQQRRGGGDLFCQQYAIHHLQSIHLLSRALLCIIVFCFVFFFFDRLTTMTMLNSTHSSPFYAAPIVLSCRLAVCDNLTAIVLFGFWFVLFGFLVLFLPVKTLGAESHLTGNAVPSHRASVASQHHRMVNHRHFSLALLRFHLEFRLFKKLKTAKHNNVDLR